MRQLYSRTKLGIPFGGDSLPLELLNSFFRLPKRNGKKKEKDTIRYNPFDAYRDLMWRACEQDLRQTVSHGKTIALTAGQIVTTFSELARDWDWHRTDTKEFLMRLQAEGFLKVDAYDKFCVITFSRYASKIADFITAHPKTQRTEAERKAVEEMNGIVQTVAELNGNAHAPTMENKHDAAEPHLLETSAIQKDLFFFQPENGGEDAQSALTGQRSSEETDYVPLKDEA